MNNIAIIWVKNYDKASIFGLANADETAKGFAIHIKANVALNRCEDNANDELFQGGDKAAVEKAHAVYFAGHGSRNGPLFSDKIHNDGIANPGEMQLGKGSLAFAVFDCCEVLKDRMKWINSFKGLHYIFGFYSEVTLRPDRGRRFAEILRSGASRPSVAEAWIRASLETGGLAMPWRILRALAEKDTTADETWSDDTQPERGPDPPYAIISRAEVVEDRQLLAMAIRDKMRLFRTPLPSPSETRITDLSSRFDSSFPNQTTHGGWTVRQSNKSSLEVAQASDSIWFTGRYPQVRRIFEIPPDNLPNQQAAIAAADDFLLRAKLADCRLARPFTSITEEIHDLYSSPSGWPWTAARHVNYTWTVDGLPVFGSGAMIRVTFEGPEVTSFLRFWREPAQEPPADKVQILTLKEAQRLLRSDPYFTSTSTSIAIHHWSLGYFALPPTVEQDHLLPVYRFEGIASSPGLTQAIVRYVQAVPEGLRKEFPEGSAFHLPAVL